jgi:C4-type Zn-finger protein
MEGKQSRPKTFDGKRECKFCGERDLSKLVSRVIAFRGKIVKRVVICMKCLGKLLPCPENENH